MFRPMHLRSQKLRKKRREQIVFWIALIALLIISTVFLLSEFSQWRRVRVMEIEVVGNKVVTEQAIREIAERVTSGRTLFFFDPSNVFIYPRGSIESALRASFPRLAEAEVSVTGFQSARVEVGEREPVGVWCADAPTSPEDSLLACYLIDRTGFIYAEAPRFSGDPFFVYWGGDGAVGEHLIDPQAFRELSFFLETVRDQLSLNPTEIHFVDTDQYEVALAVEGGGVHRPRIVFDPQDDYGTILEDLRAVLQSDEFSHPLASIDYIDLRYDNRVFFRLE